MPKRKDPSSEADGPNRDWPRPGREPAEGPPRSSPRARELRPRIILPDDGASQGDEPETEAFAPQPRPRPERSERRPAPGGGGGADARTTLAELRQQVATFVRERDWEQFHNPKDLAAAIAIEAAELQERFLWQTADEAARTAQSPEGRRGVEDELADVVLLALSLANACQLELAPAIQRKLGENADKYPAKQVRGRADKYTAYQPAAPRPAPRQPSRPGAGAPRRPASPGSRGGRSATGPPAGRGRRSPVRPPRPTGGKGRRR